MIHLSCYPSKFFSQWHDAETTTTTNLIGQHERKSSQYSQWSNHLEYPLLKSQLGGGFRTQQHKWKRREN